MGLFGSPNVGKLTAKRDLNGLAKALTDDDRGVRESAAKALADIGDPAAVPLIVERLSGVKDEAVIATGAGALRAMGGQAASVLAAGLRDSGPDRRPAYSALLGRLGPEHGLAPLLEASRDGDMGMRGTAAMGLGLIVTPEATARLTEIFEADEDMNVRGLAALALTNSKHPGAYETFTAALDDPEPVTRALGAIGLGSLGDTRALRPLDVLATKDDDERVRNAARSAFDDLQG